MQKNRVARRSAAWERVWTPWRWSRTQAMVAATLTETLRSAGWPWDSSFASPAALPPSCDEEVALHLSSGQEPLSGRAGLEPLESNPIRSLLSALYLPQLVWRAWPCWTPFLSLVSFGVCTPNDPNSRRSLKS